jgi:hypothetical protein
MSPIERRGSGNADLRSGKSDRPACVGGFGQDFVDRRLIKAPQGLPKFVVGTAEGIGAKAQGSRRRG